MGIFPDVIVHLLREKNLFYIRATFLFYCWHSIKDLEKEKANKIVLPPGEIKEEPGRQIRICNQFHLRRRMN